MLSTQGQLPAYARFRHKPRPNPMVELPDNAPAIREKVTHCLITHSQAFGIRALQHTDHLDPAGERFHRNRNIPVICQRKDAAYLAKCGFKVQF